MDRGAWLVSNSADRRGPLRFHCVSAPCLVAAVSATLGERSPELGRDPAPLGLAEKTSSEFGTQFGDVLVEGHKDIPVRRRDAASRPGGRGSRIAAGDRRSRRAGEPKCEAQRSISGEPLVLEAGPPGLVHWKSRSDSGPPDVLLGETARSVGHSGPVLLTRWLSIAGEPIATDSVDLKRRLFETHGARERPLCLCRRPGVPMYVARVDSAVILKRMPLTGPHHDPTCDSYEPPPELSSRDEVLGAIAEDADDSAIRS